MDAVEEAAGRGVMAAACRGWCTIDARRRLCVMDAGLMSGCLMAVMWITVASMMDAGLMSG